MKIERKKQEAMQTLQHPRHSRRKVFVSKRRQHPMHPQKESSGAAGLCRRVFPKTVAATPNKPKRPS